MPSPAHLSLLTLAVVCFTIVDAGVTVLASSKIDKCTLDGSVNGNMTLACSNKLLLLLSMTTENVASSEFRIFVSNAENGSDLMTLDQTMTIKLTMSPILVNYPIDYKQHVNTKPYEVIYLKPLIPGCEDGASAENPTCGWQYDNNGSPIQNSQGFCCLCEFDDVFGGDRLRRAGLDCNLFGNSFSSASCPRFPESWHKIYEVGSPTISWVISITTQMGSYPPRVVQVSPMMPIALDPEAKLLAKFSGNFAPTTSNPTFSDKYLLVPDSITNPLTYVDEWMLVDKTMADLTGETCNKIGVGYTAFKFDSDRCRKPAGTCLEHQPGDLYKEDLDLLAQGHAPNYLLKRWGTPVVPPNQWNQQFSFEDPQRRASVITLELAADDFAWVVYLSDVKIVQASINDFESTSRDGTLDVQLLNYGNLPTSILVTVTDCPEVIQPIPSQQLTLAESQTDALQFSIYATTTLPMYCICNVSVWNDVGTLQDTMLVGFNVSLPATWFGDQGSNGTAPGTTTEVVYDSIGCGCRSFALCPSLSALAHVCTSSSLDLICYAGSGCWQALLVFAIVLAGIIAGLVIMVKLRKQLFCCCKPGKGKTDKNWFRKAVKKLSKKEAAATSPTPGTNPKPSKEMTTKAQELELQDTGRSHKVVQETIEAGEPRYVPIPVVPKQALIAAVGSGAFVYLNVKGGGVGAGFRLYPGESFSICGHLLMTQVPSNEEAQGEVKMLDAFEFTLDEAYHNQRWYVTETAVMDVEEPLDNLSELVNTILLPSQAQQCITIANSRYPCINIAQNS